MELKLSLDGSHALIKKLEDATMLANKALLRALRRIGLRLQRTMMGKVSDDLLKVRTGNLRRAIFYRVEGREQESLVRVGVDLTKAIYGRIQNVGGEIRPVRSKFLTIPLGPNLTGSGVMRVSAREFIANPSSIGFVRSFVTRNKTAIMGVLPSGQVQPVFALVRSVRIRPTGYIERSLADDLLFIEHELDEAAVEVAKDLTSAE